jgi:hypothetical protein
VTIAAGLALALLSALALNWGWVAQHSAVGGLPELTLRRPLRSLKLLYTDRDWLAGVAVGGVGWAFYIGALALAPLSLVQATCAGGMGVLAFAARRRGAVLTLAQWAAVGLAALGLVLLGASLAGGVTGGGRASSTALIAWLAVSAAAALLAAVPAALVLAGGAGLGAASGILYAAGDVATKSAVGGGTAWRVAVLVAALLAAHGTAAVCLQLGFQRGDALATAGTSMLLTNSLPILAGILLFADRLPGGALGAIRVLAFACVVVAAGSLARRAPAVSTAVRR